VKKDIGNWMVMHHYTQSYLVRCRKCGCAWKTQAKYVRELREYVPGKLN